MTVSLLGLLNEHVYLQGRKTKGIKYPHMTQNQIYAERKLHKLQRNKLCICPSSQRPSTLSKKTKQAYLTTGLRLSLASTCILSGDLCKNNAD